MNQYIIDTLISAQNHDLSFFLSGTIAVVVVVYFIADIIFFRKRKNIARYRRPKITSKLGENKNWTVKYFPFSIAIPGWLLFVFVPPVLLLCTLLIFRFISPIPNDYNLPPLSTMNSVFDIDELSFSDLEKFFTEVSTGRGGTKPDFKKLQIKSIKDVEGLKIRSPGLNSDLTLKKLEKLLGPGTHAILVENKDQLLQNSYGKSLILFLHGWKGDETTFNQFPKLITTDPKMWNFDVSQFNYPIYITRRNLRVPQIADVIRNQLIRNRAHDKYEKIYLVAHSLGGVIARKLLVTNRLSANKLPIRGIISLGSPFKGALGGYLGVIGLGGQITADIKPDSQFLRDLNADWLHAASDRSKTWWHCFTSPIDNIVDQESAQTGCGKYKENFASVGHVEMVKPDNLSDERYTRVTGTILVEAEF